MTPRERQLSWRFILWGAVVFMLGSALGVAMLVAGGADRMRAAFGW